MAQLRQDGGGEIPGEDGATEALFLRGGAAPSPAEALASVANAREKSSSFPPKRHALARCLCGDD